MLMKIFLAVYQKGTQDGKTTSVEFAFLMKASIVGDSRTLIAKSALAHQITFLLKYRRCQTWSYNEGPIIMAQ